MVTHHRLLFLVAIIFIQLKLQLISLKQMLSFQP
jgi:hypothetical protein